MRWKIVMLVPGQLLPPAHPRANAEGARRGHFRRLAAAVIAAAPVCWVPAAIAQMPPQDVVVAPILERDVPASIRLVGTVLAERSAVVAAEVSGVVAEFPAAEGQFLRRGELICRLQPEPAQYALDEARGRLGALRAALEELENGTRAEVIEQLRAQMEEAEALLRKWELEKKRVDELYARNQASLKEKNDTDQEHLASQRRLAQVRAAYQEAVNGPRPEAIARARAEVFAQEGIVRRLERDLKCTQVTAPFDGFVTARRTEVGEWIATGGPVCEMVAIETVKVRVDAPESTILYAEVGAPASVRADALGRVFEARISRVIPRANASARTFPIEIDLPNGSHELLPGMFVWAFIPAGPSGQRLVVDKDAIVTRGGVQQVFVVRPMPDGSHMAFPATVTTGLEWANEVEVRGEGLAAGGLVVVRGNERLFAPAPVRPVTATGSRPAAGPDARGAVAGHNE